MTTISSIDARYAQVQVGEASKKVSASVQNLVSGSKANANVADLSVGTVLAVRVNTLRVAVGNAGQGKSLLETAKGGLNTILGLLQQQKSLATKSSDDSLGNNERGFLNQEFQALVSEIDRIAATANFNGKALLDGSISGSAGAGSATGLSTENYSLIHSNQFGAAGTTLSGDLTSTAAVLGENTITFGTVATGTANETITLADVSGNFGAAAGTGAITFTTTTGDSGATAAAAFVTAAKASTNIIVRQFDFIDNGDGTVSVKARNANADVQTVTFVSSVDTAHHATTIGNDGSTTTIDSGGGAQAFSVDQSTSTVGTNGTLSVIQSASVAKTAGSTTLAITSAAGAAGAINLVIGGQTVATHTAVATTDTAVTIANALAALATSSTNDYARRFTFVSDGAGNITITNTILGTNTANDTLQFQITGAGAPTATLGGADVVSATKAFISGTATVGTYRAANVSDAEQTFEETLQGAITNLTATYTSGTGGANNTVQFSADVGGKTYTSQVVNLYSSTTGTGTDSNTILANTVLTFSDPDGPRETGGYEYTDQAFQLRLGSTAVSTITNQTTANTFADAIQTQIAGLTITQNRSLNVDQVNPSSGDHRITAAIGTILEGLRGFDATGADITAYNNGDILINADAYGTTGTFGSVGAFTVNRLTDTITTTLNGETYTAYLNSSNAPTTGGVKAFGLDATGATNDGSYNSTTKIIDLTPSTARGLTPKLIFYSASTTDGNTITIDLGNVSKNTSQINISTAEGEAGLKAALDAAFNVSSNDSLSFQVGNDASDTIGISISGTTTTDVYLNDSGVATTLSVDTIANAVIASDVLDNAINNVVSRISNVSAKITSFNSSIQNNQASIQNADAARSVLLDTDYTQESTLFAESRVRVDAATAVLSQINARATNLLQLLRQ